MKFPFHITLLTLIVGLLIITGVAIAWTSYRNASSAVEDLSEQILAHAEKRIDQQINQLLISAIEQCELNRSRLESPRFSEKDYQPFAADLVNLMKQNRWFTTIGLTLATGQSWEIKEESEGAISVIVGHWDGGTGKFHFKEYLEADYPKGPSRDYVSSEDPREQPTFVQTRSAGKQIWMETRLLPKLKGVPDQFGLTCATPVKRDGVVVGVFTTTFYLSQLCDFLKVITTGEEGFHFTPFVLEFKKDGTRSVIAHPDRDILSQPAGEADSKGQTALVPAKECRDPLVHAFLTELHREHPGLDPTELKQMTEAELQRRTTMRFEHDGVRYRGTYRCLSRSDTPDWLICLVVPESSILGRVEQGNRNNLILLLCIGIMAVLISLLVAFQVARPLQRLARQTEAIGQFHLEAEPIPPSIVKEVDRLAVAMESMKTSLRSFRKYVPAEVVRALLAAGQDAVLGGERRVITIYFSDIANFTSISEQLTPEQLVSQLAEYLSVQSDPILESQGTVDKYIGDAIMAFWGAPALNPQQAQAACTTAIRNQEKLRTLRVKWQAENKPMFATRIGIHTGEVIVGNIGSAARLNYTVIGDAVNLASRLEGMNKFYDTEILISESTYLAAKEGVVARPLDWVSVKGKSVSVLVYELLGLKGEVSKSIEELVEVYSLALTHYRKQDWTRAIELFEEVLRLRSQDQPARQMLKRCQDYQATPPPAGWDGVHHMTAK